LFFAGKIPVSQCCRGNQTNTQQNFQDQTQIFFHGYSKKVIEKKFCSGAILAQDAGLDIGIKASSL
jgi:hypothetical protein